MSKVERNVLHHRMFGNGRPVVFLHGFLESHTMWEHLPLEVLNRTCILVDLPGHGKSPLSGDGEPSILHYAQKVDELLAAMGVFEYDLVGHSMGGYVALELMDGKKGCGKVVLLNSNFWCDSAEKKKDRVRVADIVLKAKGIFLREAIPNLFSAPERFEVEIRALIEEADQGTSEGYAYAALAMRNRRDLTDAVKENAERVLVLQGKSDAIVPLSLMLENAGEGVDVRVLKAAGHMAHIEQPEEVMKHLSQFLTL